MAAESKQLEQAKDKHVTLGVRQEAEFGLSSHFIFTGF